nr:alpha/beta hydrolases superfamily protein [Tanacetum cinerariifolium]
MEASIPDKNFPTKREKGKNESKDSAFARFNTIITNLKALDKGYYSNNRNLKHHEIIIKKDFEIVKANEERKCLTLKAKKESSDKECSTSRSEDEEYAMTVRDFKKFFKRRECPKPLKDKNQRAFVGGSWSDSSEEDDEKAIDETCLVAQASNEIYLEVDLEPDEWLKDSGCSKYMLGNQNLFSSYKAYNGGNVNLHGNIIGKDEEEAIKVFKKKILENDTEDETLEIDEVVNIKESRNHPL